MKNFFLAALFAAAAGFPAAPLFASINPTTQNKIETLIKQALDTPEAIKGVDSSQDPTPAIRRHVDQIFIGPLADKQYQTLLANVGRDTDLQYEVRRIQLEQDAKGILAYVDYQIAANPNLPVRRKSGTLECHFLQVNDDWRMDEQKWPED